MVLPKALVVLPFLEELEIVSESSESCGCAFAPEQAINVKGCARWHTSRANTSASVCVTPAQSLMLVRCIRTLRYSRKIEKRVVVDKLIQAMPLPIPEGDVLPDESTVFQIGELLRLLRGSTSVVMICGLFTQVDRRGLETIAN